MSATRPVKTDQYPPFRLDQSGQEPEMGKRLSSGYAALRGSDSTMKALVVYESMFGKAEQIARAIADGLGESLVVQVVEVADASTNPGPEVGL